MSSIGHVVCRGVQLSGFPRLVLRTCMVCGAVSRSFVFGRFLGNGWEPL